MEDREIRSILERFDDRQKHPFVRKDGTISDIEAKIVSEMQGIRIVRDKHGRKVYKERRRGRCIFCDSKKCTEQPPVLDDIVRGGFAVEICTCYSKKFRGRIFGRDNTWVEERWPKLQERGRKETCPQCGANQLILIAEKVIKSVCDSRPSVGARKIQCKTCGFTGSFMLMEEDGELKAISHYAECVRRMRKK